MKAFISMWRMDLRFPCRILWYIPLGPHHDRLATHHLSHREMATRDTHVPCICRRDDDHVIGCFFILGLLIHGLTVIGTCVFNVAGLCGELLGVTPLANALRGSTISIRWLCDQLSTPPPEADEVTLKRSAHGFILKLIGSFLFANKKGVHVQLCFLPLLRDLTHTTAYSWGGAVLA